MGILDLLGARYVLKGLVIAASLAAFTALSVLINNLIAGIAADFPTFLQTGLYVLPGNLGLCLSAVIAATIGRWAYDFQRSRMMMVGNG
ncbi:MAG: DUF5455 family protein [Rhodocyclaceae bacterium]|jgi:hypothetical protein|nr:DUF5455 family protein [Rhodocyclaceae bacterium]